jgi:N-acetylmuramoyl-L-alanine amidase
MARMPGIPFDQGSEAQGSLSPTAVILHRTYGSWNGDYSVGVGTGRPGIGFHFLVGKQSGNWVQFYDTRTKCSHCAGANSWSVGIEFEGKNEEQLTPWQIQAGGEIIRWLSADVPIPLDAYYDGPRKGQSREFRGHRTVEGSDHGDYVTRADFDKMTNNEEAELMAAADDIIAGVNAHTDNANAVQGQASRVLLAFAQAHRFEVDPDGRLRHQWHDPTANGGRGGWFAETWAEGADPSSRPDVLPNYRNQMHVFVAAADPAKLVHAFLDLTSRQHAAETIPR